MNRPESTLDRYDLTVLEGALDGLEALHDFEAQQFRSEYIRECLCMEASTWRQARKVLKRVREDLSLPPRLLWTV